MFVINLTSDCFGAQEKKKDLKSTAFFVGTAALAGNDVRLVQKSPSLQL